MLVVSMVVFVLARLTGDPLEIMMPAEATKEDIAMMRAYLGLDRPWPVQYWRFISRAEQGDFGRSVRFNRPALAVVTERYPATLELGGLAILIVMLWGCPSASMPRCGATVPSTISAGAWRRWGRQCHRSGSGWFWYSSLGWPWGFYRPLDAARRPMSSYRG